MRTLCSLGLLLARFLIAILFIMAGIGKFKDPAGTAAYMASKGMTIIPFFLYAAALIEIIGGILILFGYQIRLAATILFLFLIPVTVIFHDFWNVAEPERMMEMSNFLKNLAVMGGLLYVICHGAGVLSVDAFLQRKEDKR